MSAQLTLCVDDYGMHEGIDRAVFDLHALGRLGAVSAMVGAGRWRAAGRALRDIDARATDVGLHLDLTEHPLDAALRRPLPAWIASAWVRIVPAKRLRAEIVAQIDAFEAVIGRAPAHVDGHQHVHQFPVVRDLLVDALAQRYPANARPWLRGTRPPGGAGAKARVIHGLGGAALRRLARERGFATNGRLLGVYDFSGDAQAYRARMAGWLAQARDGDLLMCHPAARGAAADDPLLAARRIEAEILLAPDFAAMLRAAGITLGRLRVAPAHVQEALSPP